MKWGLERAAKQFSEKAHPIGKDDALQMWIDLDTHLQFADQTIQKSELPLQARTALVERLQHIRARKADPNMYLAVVGEFSTGKSTFINALLHEEILKTSVDVTTATSTRICYGPQIDLEVRFRSMNGVLSYTRDHNQLWKQIRKLSRNIPGAANDIHTYITAVTSNNEVAASVESVVIHHPTPFLANGIVIIDTPGINAEYDTHRQITHTVVQNEADAAVIIIPAPVPLAQTLTTFLSESLRPFLHRCLFVVTQMDKIQERDQARLLENIRKRLSKVLDSDQPLILYEAAPQVVLDTLQQQPVAPGLEHWYGRFTELEQILWDRLRQERVLSITESLLRLMMHLFEELGKHLSTKQSTYQTRQQAIQRETIQDISSFTAQQQQYYQSRIGAAATAARLEFEAQIMELRSSTQDRIYQAIFGADSASDLKSILENTVTARMQNASDTLQEELEERIEDLKQATAEASASFDTHFTEEYRKLQALGGSASFALDQNLSKSIVINVDNILYSAGKITDEMDGTSLKLGWGGAAAGAALGTMIFPGVGTLAGLFVGPLLVSMFGPSLQERKTQVWDAVRQALNSSFQKMKTQGYTILDAYENEARRAFNQRVSAYMQQYKVVVDRMLQQQQQELTMLKRLQETVQADQQEIERRSNALKQKQQLLAQRNA